MVPCPWFPEIADYAKSHPDFDFGLHLTLTSERVYYRWGPVAPAGKVPSLLDNNGYLHHDWTRETHIDPAEAEIELRAQIDRAYAMGVRPTHLDSHQYRLDNTNKDLFEVALRLAHQYKLPFFVTRDWFADFPYLEKTLGPIDVVIDHTITIEPDVFAAATTAPEKWAAFYHKAIRNMQPGVTELGHPPRLRRPRNARRHPRTRHLGRRLAPTRLRLLHQCRLPPTPPRQHIQLITWRQIATGCHTIDC